MKDFKELVTLLGKNHLPLDDTKLGLRARELYLYVRRVAEPTDQGAARKLKLEKGSGAYRKVKHKLKYALLDGITAVKRKPGVVRDRPAAALACWGTIALARSTPQAYGLIPRELIDHQLQQTQDYDLLEAASQLTDILADRPSVGPDVVHYLDRSDYLGALGFYMAELLEATFYILQLRNAQAPLKEVEVVARETLDRLLPMKDRFNYILWHYHLFAQQINYFLSKNEYKKVLVISEDALSYFAIREASKKYEIPFKIYKASSYLQLCEFEKGIKVLEELLTIDNISSRDYYRVQELTIQLCLRTGNFQKAYNYYNGFKLAKANKLIGVYFTETILIFEAYIYFYINMGVVSTSKKDNSLKKFRLKKFLNTFEFASKEKESRNVQIVIIRALFDLLQIENANNLIELDYLEKYMRRHLNSNEFERSALFIRSLLFLGKKGTTLENIGISNKKYISKMTKYSFYNSHQDSYVEIVQYERLWSDLSTFLLNNTVR